MHNRKEPDYTDFIADFLKDMQETIDIAKKAGIADENIILDPGVGFGKTYENNLEIINKLECMHTLGYPILLGTSRKSVIGLTLDLPADQRMEGTVASAPIMSNTFCAPYWRRMSMAVCTFDTDSMPKR